DVFVVGDAHTDGDAGALRDIVRAARQMGQLRDDLLDEARNGDFDPIGGIDGPLLLHDLDLDLGRFRVMGANLRPVAVLQRGDDAAAVGVVLRVGGGDDQYVQWQSNLMSTNLDVSL